ncbi:hypothetical protein DL93DRAFT_2071924 [Clavulina sp. PMI_390]|nr:hypothetical protein DL93DRAFT_2071924 [Clavulina sp. PMI_390]
MPGHSLTIIGTPFSTFTRTITLSLEAKGLAYKQIATAPHSQTADKHHPFGHLPTLVVHGAGPAGKDFFLRESTAIVRYIDRIAPGHPILHLSEANDMLPEKMWEFVSLVQSNAYPILEVKMIKIRVKHTDEGKLSAAEIGDLLSDAVAEARVYIAKIEPLMASGGFVFGKTLTWADYFLYPLLADLEATPESHLITPRLKEWLGEMKKLAEVKTTEPGTLALGGRPPES